MLLMLSSYQAHAQAQEIQQLALNVQKLAQLKKILTTLKQGYEIVYKGYNTVKDLSKGNFNLHETFLNELLEISPAVRNYKKVSEIISIQVKMVQEYQRSYNRFKADPNFNSRELDYLGSVYDNLIEKSVKNLDELTMVLTAKKLRMSDDERLQAIDRIHADIEDKLLFLKDFNNQTKLLAVQRAKAENDVNTLKAIYGIKQ